jgi:hypothetical protein
MASISAFKTLVNAGANMDFSASMPPYEIVEKKKVCEFRKIILVLFKFN